MSNHHYVCHLSAAQGGKSSDYENGEDAHQEGEDGR